MQYVINATEDHAKIQLPARWQKDTHDGNLIIRDTTNRTRLRQGDQFVSLITNSKAEYFSEKIMLASKGYVNKIDTIEAQNLTAAEVSLNDRRKKEGKRPLRFYDHQVSFVSADPFKKHKYLDDYSYSLFKIYKRYIKPSRHFSKQVTSIDTFDFTTFNEERIFIDRTLFGRLINSLSLENRLQFILFAIDEFETVDLRDIRLSEIYPYIMDFIGSGIIKTGKYLIECEQMIKNLNEVFNDVPVGFADFPNKKFSKKELSEFQTKIKPDLISEQVRQFEELFSISKNYTNLFSTKRLKRQADSQLFEQKFRKRSLPIDLSLD